MRTNYVPPARNLVMEYDGIPISGRVRSCLSDELVVSLPRGTVLPVGRELELTVSGGRLARPMGISGTVRRRVESKSGRLYGLAHGIKELAGHIPTPGLPERRRWNRVKTPGEVPVVLSTEGIDVAGYIVDVSAGGLAVRLTRAREGMMSAHESAVVLFIPPGCKEQVTRHCRIRSRLLTPEGLRYGLKFDAPDKSVQFEAIWRCGRCGQNGLLATSQPHCLDCGNRRTTEKTQLPSWDALVPVERHRFTGFERDCKACGACWSDKAAHCGQCGTALY